MTQRRAQTVSLCMIVRNEERHLHDCLAPVAGLFDEVIIVDTGSQDRTPQIAAQFATRVVHFPWCDDFSAARNESLRHATGDWIFWLDADDRIRPPHLARLAALMDSLDERPRVFMLDTVSLPADVCEIPWVVTHPRLFRRHPALHWEGRAHEQLRPDDVLLGYEAVASDIQIEHLGYKDAALLQRKRHRTLRLLRMDYAVNPDDTSTLFHLGMAYAHTGALTEARKHLLRLIELQPGPAEHMCRVYAALAELAAKEGNFDEALAAIRHGLGLFPADEQLLYLRAQIHYEMQQFQAAIQDLQAIANGSAPPRLQGGGPGQIKRKLVPRTLAAVLRRAGALAESEALFRQVLAEHPTDTASWYDLGLVYLDTENAPRLHEVVEQLYRCPQGRFYAHLLTALWQMRHQQLEPAGALIDQLVAEAPWLPLPRMLRAEWLSRSGAPLDDQIRTLHDLLRLQPHNLEALQWLGALEAYRVALQSTQVIACYQPVAAAPRVAPVAAPASPASPTPAIT